MCEHDVCVRACMECVCVHVTVRQCIFVESVLSFHFTWVSENKLRSPRFDEQGPLLIPYILSLLLSAGL